MRQRIKSALADMSKRNPQDTSRLNEAFESLVVDDRLLLEELGLTSEEVGLCTLAMASPSTLHA